jgi:hypothetical protein
MRIVASVALVLLCAASGSAIDCTIDPATGLPPTPIVINLAKGPYRLTGAESPVTFDFYATGQPTRMGWTAPEADLAFLCLDRDYSGTIDNGAEFFGNATRLTSDIRAQNGFEALTEFDDNHDFAVDEQDAIWTQLILWRDVNHDAISQLDELVRVVDSGVAAISLRYHWSGRLDSSGNALRYESKVWIAEEDKRATPRPVYDVFFVRVPQ